MAPTILATKLYLPPYRPNLVARQRLIQALSTGLNLGRRLSLICAPAGFGKTTLAVEWLHSLAAQVGGGPALAWLSLDPADNDLRVFFGYLAAALQKAAPGAGEETRQMLESSPLPPTEALLLPLLNDLAGRTEPILLVLDDYHAIQLPALHEAMAFLIERQPPQMHTLITTRQDPLLPLARWRARGLLSEIRLGELRFTAAETSEFLQRTLGLGLPEEDVTALETRTEGWIAGLQLAAVSLQQAAQEGGAGASSGFIQAFAGDDRYVMDYLIDEVLSRQPPAIQSFLLHTAVLERFNASLCQAVLGDGEDTAGPPQVTLAYLDRANLFLIPLDNRREWYRYHHLFAELLRHRLQLTEGPGSAAGIQQRASRWFDEHGLADEAIQYAQAAADWGTSARLIARYSPPMIQESEAAGVLRWLAGMPEAAICQDPLLCRIYGYALTATGKLDRGLSFLRAAEKGFAASPDDLGSTLTFASYNACFQGDFDLEISQARRALELLAPENQWMRGVAAVSLGLGLFHTGSVVEAEQAIRAAYAAGVQAGSTRTCAGAQTYLGRMAVLRLDFNEAEARFQQAAGYQTNGRQFSGADIPLFDLAQLKTEQNDLEAAWGYVEQGLAVNRRSGSIEMRAYGYRQAARLHQLKGEREAAQEHLHKALRLAGDYNLSPLTLSLNAACQMEMAMAEGDLQAAEMAAPRVTNSLGLYPFCFYPELARVRLLLLQARREEALDLLEPARRRAEQPGWEYPRLQVRVLQAMAASSQDEAQRFLREALALGLPVGAVRTFADLGAPLLALLQDLRRRLDPALAAYAGWLMAAFDLPKAPLTRGKAEPARVEMAPKISPAQGGEIRSPAPRRIVQDLVEPLSERELEVLQLVGDGLSNAEIAQKLYLSPNTLKAHTQNIYAKLDVHSRVQAVNKARELGLME